jgi:hypothetical protein
MARFLHSPGKSIDHHRDASAESISVKHGASAWLRARLFAAAALSAGAFGGVAGCGSEHERSEAPPPVSTQTPRPYTSDGTNPPLCARSGSDAVKDVFCAGDRLPITSLSDLQRQLKIAPDRNTSGTALGIGAIGAVLGHSTSLSGHVVSAINPRVIMPREDNALIFAFQRGVQRAEIAAIGRDDGILKFYLVTFTQACNGTSEGCRPGDLYTPSIESGWTNVDLQDDEELKNTPSDCRQCHERGREAPVLLMRELQSPWTHFFTGINSDTDPKYLTSGIDGSMLTAQFQKAKGAEPYAGLAFESLQRTIGFVLQLSVDATQPLLFDAPTIMNERFPYTEGADWPGPPQRSATWDAEYAAFKRGEHLALPYFDAVVTDPDKLSRLTDAYQNFLAEKLSPADLPDLSDIFPDDATTRAEIGLQTEPGATPAEALIQACGNCHNDVLDQTISRARFNVAVSRLDHAELEIALDRLTLPDGDPRKMPPAESRQLDSVGRDRLVDYLTRAEFPAPDQAMLTRAAMLGMVGNSRPTPAY